MSTTIEPSAIPLLLQLHCNKDGAPVENGSTGDTRLELIVYVDGSVECADLEAFEREAVKADPRPNNLLVAISRLALRAQRAEATQERWPHQRTQSPRREPDVE